MISWRIPRIISALSLGLRSVEREFLGYELPPPDSELADRGWVPDPPGSWCLRCGSGRPAASRSSRGCPECRGRRLPFESVVRLGAYREPLDGWLLRIKRRSWHSMAERLGDRLGEQCLAVWGPSSIDGVVPVPMPPLRRLWRGIDHSAALASRVARTFRVPLVRLLVHGGDRTQVGRSRTERLRRRSPFRLHPRAMSRGSDLRRIVLVDDVRSTGSTVRQACRLLAERFEGLEIRVAVVAIAEREIQDGASFAGEPLDSWSMAE